MRYRKKRRSNGGGGGRGVGMWAGSLAIIFGAVALVICLITFGIAIDQLDTSVTSAISYTEMIGLDDVMGVMGMVIFIVFMALGLGGLVGGSIMQWRQAMGGGWASLFMVAIMGAVTVVIALVVNDVALEQLDAAMTTVNSTTNYSSYFTGLFNIMGVFGLVIFVSLLGAALSQFAGFGVGAYRKLSGR